MYLICTFGEILVLYYNLHANSQIVSRFIVSNQQYHSLGYIDLSSAKKAQANTAAYCILSLL